jgi:putative flippase GtrA
MSEFSRLQLICYALIGIASNLAGYVAYLLLTYVGIFPKVAMTALYCCSSIISFFGNSRLTFAHAGNKNRAFIRYLVTYAAGYLMNLVILTIGVDQLGYSHQIVQAFAIASVAAFLFACLKYYVFEKPLE